MGHIYDRSWKQTYESSVFQWNKKRTGGKVNYSADLPEGAQLVFDIRSSTNKTRLINEKWTRINDSGQFQLPENSRFLQYRAVLISDNGDRFPVLDRVTVELTK